MKLLLDENLPHELRHELPGHDAYTVHYMGWKGLSNGVLLAQAAGAGFEALITLDSGVQYQQNVATLPISVFLLSAPSNDIDDIRPLIPKLLIALNHLQSKTIVHIP
jgi:predicted nuclease of predicted toxin-antitoxin system